MRRKLTEAKQYIKERLTSNINIGLVLGSGLGELAEQIQNPLVLPYKDIPHFPVSTVPGHEGQLVIGTVQDKEVVAMQGRFHYYEGYSMDEVVLPIRVMSLLGIDSLIVTNAAGGINDRFSNGDLMIIEDHLNFFGTNPLIGPNDETLGPRFPDMTEAYDRKFIQLTKDAATKLNIPIQQGVYAGVTGPVYETPSEVKMLQVLGADAVGMSTVPEVIAARHMGLRVLGITCISNLASGINTTELSHEEVIKTTNHVKASFIRLVKQVIATM